MTTEPMLIIDTSRRPFNVVLGHGRECVFDSLAAEFPDTRDLPMVVAQAFRQSGLEPQGLAAVAVNVGPGALGSVRAGVSFGNALAYGLGLPVYPVTSFELMGFAVAERQPGPVLCSARASNGQAYVGLYRDGGLASLGFGQLEELAPAAIDGVERVAIAGEHRADLCALLDGSRAFDSGVEQSRAATFLRLDPRLRRAASVFPEVVTPVTEDSVWLRDQP